MKKIVVLNYGLMRVDVLNIAEECLTNGVEEFLLEHGYRQGFFSWMSYSQTAKYHTYGICQSDGKEIHACKDINLWLVEPTIDASVKALQRHEQKELVDALRRCGDEEDGGYEFHFEGDFPRVAAYLYDEPRDVAVMAVRSDEFDNVILLVQGEDGYGREIDADEVFAGHLESVTDEIYKVQ